MHTEPGDVKTVKTTEQMIKKMVRKQDVAEIMTIEKDDVGPITVVTVSEEKTLEEIEKIKASESIKFPERITAEEFTGQMVSPD